jgi:hypothetical protein
MVSPVTLWAKATLAGWADSAITGASYSLQTAPPVFSPAPDAYVAPEVITMTSPTPGATIYFTTNGEPPSTSSPSSIPSGGTVTINETTHFRAIAARADQVPSDPAEASYEILPAGTQVAAPVFDPAGGTLVTARTVTVTTSTPGATIRYTTNGEEPTGDDLEAVGGTIPINGSVILMAKAWKNDFVPSQTTSVVFVVTGAVAAGRDHTLALASDGTLWAWGANACGQLGDESGQDQTSPAHVHGLDSVQLVAIAGGFYHSLALDSNGSVWAWGNNDYGQLGDHSNEPRSLPTETGLTGVVAIAAGGWSSAALMADHTVRTWGYNHWGQLGNSSVTALSSNQPVQVEGLSGVTAISAGGQHDLAATADPVWAWGANNLGQLGNGLIETKRVQPVETLDLVGASQVVASNLDNQSHVFSLALVADGAGVPTVWAWGYHRIGVAEQSSEPISVISGIVSVAAGGGHALALDEEGSVWAWGSNSSGQLGNWGREDANAPVRVLGLTGVVALAGGGAHSVALRADGSVWTWGDDTSGQLGNGPVAGRSFIAAPVEGLSLADNEWLGEDPDRDGLSNDEERRFGSDPFNPDTNGDGIDDGSAVALGLSPTDPDMDDDDVPNPIEVAQGTDPLNPDTDGDGSPDGVDLYPLDPSRWEAPTPDPGDHTPPTIVIIEPPGATPVPPTP